MKINKAIAKIHGGNGYPNLKGIATLKQTDMGVLITIKVNNLPKNSMCNGGIFAVHIHDGESCTGDMEDQFKNAKTHYNPNFCPHPFHAGDLPSLIGNNGFAYMQLLTNRFTVEKVLNKVIVIHENFDDYKTQPAGNSGMKIGCGKIIRV